MGFTLRDVSRILEANHNRCRQWVSLGFIKPSIREAESRGQTNFFSRPDIYRFAILKQLIELGWAREPAGKLISSIDENAFWRCVHAWHDDFRFAKERIEANYDIWIENAIAKTIHPEKRKASSGSEITKAFSEFSEEMKKRIIEFLVLRIPVRKIYLVFLILDPSPLEVRCVPLCENPPIYSNGKALMGDIDSLTKYVVLADEVHLIEVSKIMKSVDNDLYIMYPKAFKGELHAVMRNMMGIEWTQRIEERVKELKEALEGS